MALPATIYRLDIQLSHIDRGVYQTVQTSVARHPSETAERLVARILAYLLHFDPALSFTRGVCAGDEPDLWLKTPDNRIIHWIEVGQGDFERLRKAARQAEQVILYAYGSARHHWEKQQLPQLARIANLTVIGLDYAFLQQLVTRLQRTIHWQLTVNEGHLYLNIGEDNLETSPSLLAGPLPQE